MDLSGLKPTERVIDIKHPGTDEDVGVKVTVLSLSDPKMKTIKRQIEARRLELARKNKTFKPAEIEDNEISLLFKAMTGWQWTGDANFQGEKPAFNLKNVKAVFTELEWFKDQVSEEVSDEQAFFTS